MALAAIAYWRSLRTPFVYDDHLTVTGNPSLVDPGNLEAILLHFRFRPVVNVSYAIDRAIWGPDPYGFHLTNLLLHLLNTLLVCRWRAVCSTTRWHDDDPPAALRRERASVSRSWSRACSRCTPCSTRRWATSARAPSCWSRPSSSAHCSLSGAGSTGPAARLHLGAALALFAAGLASKETAAAWPLLALAWDLVLRPGNEEQRRRRLLRFHAPLLAMVALGGAVRLASFFQAEAGLPRSFVANLVHPGHHLLALPPPAAASGRAERGARRPRPRAASRARWCCSRCWRWSRSVALAWWWRRRAPWSCWAAIWLLVALAPSSVVPLNELMAEHRVSLASVGFFLASAPPRIELWDRFPSVGARRLQALGPRRVLVVLIGLTWRRAAVWSDEVTLWTEATERAPKTWASHFFLGEALRRRDGCPASLASYRRAIPFLPYDEIAHLRIGVCLADAGTTAAAENRV